MKRSISTVIISSLATLSSGCGTMSAVGNDKMWPNQVYAGTRDSAGGHATQWDVPFSLIGDTIMLPYTIPKTMQNQKHSTATRPVD